MGVDVTSDNRRMVRGIDDDDDSVVGVVGVKAWIVMMRRRSEVPPVFTIIRNNTTSTTDRDGTTRNESTKQKNRGGGGGGWTRPFMVVCNTTVMYGSNVYFWLYTGRLVVNIYIYIYVATCNTDHAHITHTCVFEATSSHRVYRNAMTSSMILRLSVITGLHHPTTDTHPSTTYSIPATTSSLYVPPLCVC